MNKIWAGKIATHVVATLLGIALGSWFMAPEPKVAVAPNPGEFRQRKELHVLLREMEHELLKVDSKSYWDDSRLQFGYPTAKEPFEAIVVSKQSSVYFFFRALDNADRPFSSKPQDEIFAWPAPLSTVHKEGEEHKLPSDKRRAYPPNEQSRPP